MLEMKGGRCFGFRRGTEWPGAEPDRALTVEVTEDNHDAQHLQARLQVAVTHLSLSLLPFLPSSPPSLPPFLSPFPPLVCVYVCVGGCTSILAYVSHEPQRSVWVLFLSCPSYVFKTGFLTDLQLINYVRLAGYLGSVFISPVLGLHVCTTMPGFSFI